MSFLNIRTGLAVNAVCCEPVSSLQFWEMQGDSGESQGGAKAHVAKNHQISRIWMGVSLLKEQGDYHCSAGT
jgi:hypothetical protein